ncbi:CobW/HypB/UreG nucleotide-binding domain-containing protein [Pseudoscourfieldia marina]
MPQGKSLSPAPRQRKVVGSSGGSQKKSSSAAASAGVLHDDLLSPSARAPAGADALDSTEEEEPETRIPVTVISGFMGSGKTTLVRQLVTNAGKHKRFGLVEIEETQVRAGITAEEELRKLAGGLGDSNTLVAAVDTERGAFDSKLGVNAACEFSMGNKCVEATAELLRDVDKRGGINHLIVETAGLGDPLHTVRLEADALGERLYIDGVVAVVDSRNGKKFGNSRMMQVQLAAADVIVLNKMDISDPGDVAFLEKLIAQLNPTAKLVKTSNSFVKPSEVLEIRSETVIERLCDLAKKLDRRGKKVDRCFRTQCFEGPGEMTLDSFNEWYDDFSGTNLEDRSGIYRAKGVLNLRGEPRRHIFQICSGNKEFVPLDPWQPGEKRINRIVFTSFLHSKRLSFITMKDAEGNEVRFRDSEELRFEEGCEQWRKREDEAWAKLPIKLFLFSLLFILLFPPFPIAVALYGIFRELPKYKEVRKQAMAWRVENVDHWRRRMWTYEEEDH